MHNVNVKDTNSEAHLYCSYYNNAEAEVVMRYVKRLIHLEFNWKSWRKLRPHEIGIVTPYRSQCRNLQRKCLGSEYDGITIGSAEVFQGKEKPVIIISTVRSKGHNLAFVSDVQVN